MLARLVRQQLQEELPQLDGSRPGEAGPAAGRGANGEAARAAPGRSGAVGSQHGGGEERGLGRLLLLLLGREASMVCRGVEAAVGQSRGRISL